jgi:hypothetical protein
MVAHSRRIDSLRSRVVDTQWWLYRLNGISEEAAVSVMLPSAPDAGVGAARWCEWDIAITSLQVC